MRAQIAIRLSMMFRSASFNHLVSANFASEQPNTGGADQRNDQPRSPQRRLQQHDVKKLPVVDRISDLALHASGFAFEKPEQSEPDAVHRRPQTDQISGMREKKII